jgi:hypothetical protein
MKSLMNFTAHHYCLDDQIKKFERAGHVARMGKKRRIYRVLVRKHEDKRPPGRYKLRWENNIMMDIYEVKCGGTECMKLAQHTDKLQALLNVVMNFRI